MESIADVLITRGWTKGAYEAVDGSVCLKGAAGVAAGENAFIMDLDQVTGGAKLDSYAHACFVLRTVICEITGTKMSCRCIISPYNDAPERTFDEVLRVAKLADEILDAEKEA